MVHMPTTATTRIEPREEIYFDFAMKIAKDEPDLFNKMTIILTGVENQLRMEFDGQPDTQMTREHFKARRTQMALTIRAAGILA
ncbi:hypothetical protein Xaut_3660 [Xanthobacter versatilis]|uniref:Uncharacterized protein n=1 Tax=Xanthobacter autotrophicus (strain ATCC BAA-1158 / Py2) TaxID=78245 RepID=A7ILJ5_XANP2|nr:hypothetical protein Xaut_3660 [Xanthobacter autotrophicus Py2]